MAITQPRASNFASSAFGGTMGYLPSFAPDYGIMNPYFNPPIGAAPGAGPGNVARDYAGLVAGTAWYGDQAAKAFKRRQALAGPAQPEFETIDITRNPALRAEVDREWDQLAAVTPMKYDEWIAGVKEGQEDVRRQYDEYQASLDPTEFINTRRALDDRLEAETDKWATSATATQGTRAGNVAQYEKDLDILQGRREATTAGLISASRRAEDQEVKQAQRLLSKYGTGVQTGAGTAILRKIARAVGDIRIRYDQMRLAWEQGDIDKAQGIARELNGLRNQLADYESRTSEMMLDRYGNLIRAEQATAGDIERIRTTYAKEGLDAAVAQWVRGYQTAQMVADMTNRPVQEILQRAQAAGVLGNLQDVYAYQGIRRTQPMQITQPTYPTRYNEPTGIGPEAAQGGPSDPYGNVGGGEDYDPSDPFGIKKKLAQTRNQSAVPGQTLLPYEWMDGNEPNFVS
jgi:hypothetical protein